MVRVSLCSLLGLLLFAAGCGQAKGKVLGKAPDGDLRTVLAARAGDTPQKVKLEGILVEKCPVAGCWFRLQDDTGVIKVDTKSAGFVVTEIPLQTKISVAGRLDHEGEETVLLAAGLHY
jgi:uncharacterized protein YdeI (BOF family)